MALTKEFFERPTNIKATVIADSVCANTGKRITTFECEFPRVILAEQNTHRQISKNCSSSRAIPIKALCENVKDNMFVPVYWGKNKSGMQADEELDSGTQQSVVKLWKKLALDSIEEVLFLADVGVHKQIANRITEPFQMVKMVMTATEWDNFFNLRLHPASQPEFCMLAYKMYKAMEASKPMKIKAGEWHLPYVGRYYDTVEEKVCYEVGGVTVSLEQAQRVSASCVAQTSYRKTDDSLEKADKIFDMLINADVIHASPFESLATPIQERHVEGFGTENPVPVNLMTNPKTWEDGLTHTNKQGVLCSGNLVGWKSYRHAMIPNNTCWEFDFEERMKTFGEQ